MESNVNFSRIVANENSWLISSMSNAAGILSQRGLLSTSALTEFRINISGMHGGQQKQSMVEGLEQNQDLLYHYLINLMGQDQFLSTIWLQFTGRLTNCLTTILGRAQLSILEYGKKYFNRHISISDDNTYLVSEIIFDFDQFTQSSITSLSQTFELLFLCHDLPPNIKSEDLSEAFGLNVLSTNLAHFHVERLVTHRIQAIQSFFEAFKSLEKFLSISNTEFNHSLLSDQLAILGRAIIEVPEPKHFTKSMERATQLMGLALSIGEEIVADLLKKIEGKINSPIPPSQFIASRQLLGHLIEIGQKPELARTATKQLKQYLREHNISISDLLLSEGERIHESLGPITIDFVKNTGLDHQDKTVIKDMAQKSFFETSEKIRRLLEMSGQFFLILFLMAGCGVKGSLISVAEPLKPQIPLIGDGHAPLK